MRNLYQLLQVLDRWKWYYLFAGLLLVISSFIRMLEPKVLQIAIDGIVNFFHSGGQQPAEPPDGVVQFFYSLLPAITLDNLAWALVCVGLLFGALAVVQSTTRFFASIISSSNTENAIKKLRDRLFAHIQGLPMAQIDKFPTGEMIQRCTGDVDTIRNFIGTQVIELLRLAAIFAGAFWMMCLVHIPYALISVTLLLPILLTSAFFFKKERKVWDEHEEEQDKLTAIIQENLSGIRVVQAFAQENAEIDRFAKQNLAKREIGVRHVDLHMVFWPLSDLLVNLQIALSLAAGAYFSLYGQITLGEYASFFTYSVMVTWPMRSLGRVVSQLGMASVAMERIMQILDTKEEDYEGEDYEQQPIRGDIEFREVTFAYPFEEGGVKEEKDKPKKPKSTKIRNNALEKVSFKVAAGERIALMGATGSGKSTIIALLMRFYEPDSGAIFLDGRPLGSYNKSYLRQRFGVVHQKPFLFSTTIRANIGYARTNTSGKLELAASPTNDAIHDEDLIAAARDASVTDFIDKMTNGYETIVGEKGVTLSGGQKQRVALARTLMSNPDILILDDATSAVDTETEYSIQQALSRRMRDKTTFIIAHRLTSVQQADKLIVFEKGRIAEMGTHEDLLANNGFYKKVYDIQIGIEEDIAADIDEA